MRLLVVYIRTQEYMVVRTRLGCSTRLAERKRLRHRLCKAPALVRSGPRVGVGSVRNTRIPILMVLMMDILWLRPLTVQ